jgi:hypothetical protein
MLFSSKTIVKLCLTLIMECNVKPNFSEAPVAADIERINDILFGSKFTENAEEIDIEKHIYPQDAGLKLKLKNSVVYKNAMLNILLQNLLLVKKQNYSVDFFKPASVRERSLAYLQNSYDIHNIFKSLFEKRNVENVDKYENWKGNKEDADWTLTKVVGYIRKSAEFYELPKNKQKEYKAEEVEDFFKKNNVYKSSVYMDTDKHALRMRDWRLKPKEEEEDDVGF